MCVCYSTHEHELNERMNGEIHPLGEIHSARSDLGITGDVQHQLTIQSDRHGNRGAVRLVCLVGQIHSGPLPPASVPVTFSSL